MAEQYPGSWKNCSTCVFWVGPRDVDDFGDRVYVDSFNTRGKCMCRNSGWRRQQMQANSSGCNGYEKWPVLR